MTLRERLEQIILKYQLSYKWVAESNTESRLGYSSNVPPPGLLDDLISLYPQPSREVLEKIFTHYSILPVVDVHEFNKVFKWNQLLTDIMDWAQGDSVSKPQISPPYWCDHLQWYWYSDIEKAGQGYWGYKHKSPIAENIAQGWQQCPVCGAKRPERT